MTYFERLEPEDFVYFNLSEDEQRPLMRRAQRRLEEFQKRIAQTPPVPLILDTCKDASDEPWKRWTPRAGDRVGWFNIGGQCSSKDWHITVFFNPKGVDLEVIGTGKHLTRRLTKMGVNAMAELVRLCATQSIRLPVTIGCRECWYLYPDSRYKGQRIGRRDEPLMQDASVLAGTTASDFARELLGLLSRNDPGYRTELIVRQSIAREKITVEGIDLPSQVGLVADALALLHVPLQFLLQKAWA